MKGAAFAFIQPVAAPKYFGIELFGLDAAGEQMTVVSVGREEIVIGTKAGDRRHAGSLLPDVKMIVTAKYTFIVEDHQILFKVTDHEHAPAQVQQILSRYFWQHNDQCLVQIVGVCQCLCS